MLQEENALLKSKIPQSNLSPRRKKKTKLRELTWEEQGQKLQMEKLETYVKDLNEGAEKFARQLGEQHTGNEWEISMESDV